MFACVGSNPTVNNNSNILIIKFFVICVLVGGCQAKKIDPFIAAKNPYSQIGVEGYVGAAMTSCMGMAPQGPPLRMKKDKGVVSSDGYYSEQAGYFDCVDKEISKIIELQYDRACKLVEENKDKLTSLANRLLEKEVIFKDDLVNILGERPFGAPKEEEEAKSDTTTKEA